MYQKITSAFVSLKFRNYRLLWLGQFSTSMGLWADNVTRGWLMYELTGSPFMLGLTGAVKVAPILVFGLFAGVLADRYGRKPQIVISQVTNIMVNLLLAFLVVTKMVEPWHILTAGMIAGIAESFQMPARQAIVSDLVEEKYLANAIALNSIAFNISRTLGPMVAGGLIAFSGAASSYFFQTAIYSLATIWTIQLVVPANGLENDKPSSISESLKEGLVYIKKDKTILALIAMALIPSLLEHPYISLMPIFAKDIMKVGPEGLGMLMGAAGLGSISGALLAATVYRQRQRGPLLLGNAIVFSVFLVIFAFTPWFHVALPLLVVTGASHTGYTVLTNTLIQTLTPRNLRGRVMSVYFLDRGIMPLGTLLAGTMAGAIGAPWTIGLMAMGGLVVPLWIAISNQHIRKLQ